MLYISGCTCMLAQIKIEVPPCAADAAIRPPPLCEAIREDQYARYIATSDQQVCAPIAALTPLPCLVSFVERMHTGVGYRVISFIFNSALHPSWIAESSSGLGLIVWGKGGNVTV